MKKIFDITDFGAIGDGVTDCTKAIQDAIDAADSHSKIVVPPGTYLVGKLYLKGNNKVLEGCSAWGFRSYGASIFKLNSEDVDCMIDITGGFGCTIKGMCLNGGRLGENIHGVKLYWDKYNGGGEEDTPAIDDCKIGGFSGDGLHFEHVWCFSVRHSMICGNGGAGLYIDGWDAFILDNWFTGNAQGGILGGPVVASITCTGNRVEWNRRGGFVLPCGDSFNITGNFFDRSFGPALELGTDDKKVNLVTVTGNIFRRSGALRPGENFDNPDMSCHLFLRNCENTVVSGNSARYGRDDGGVGVDTPDISVILDNCRDSIFKDNTMAQGALKENLVLRGDNSSCIIKDNIMTLA